ncbi:helix-turn-helix domain-containing protein [Streptomyces bacillaris]|uniref:helix-turn-helix domain-containing protein n=1 Tax=Streptomyces bacillaris TaxID=68179 RepID=UPI00346576D0
MTIRETNRADVIPLRPLPAPPGPAPSREPLWRDLVGEALRRERRSQGRTLKDVAGAARISMPYLSEVERGRKEASSEVLAAAAQALGLTLADLLALAQGELIRLSAARSRSIGHPGHPGRPAGPGAGSGAMGTVRLAA